MPGAASEALPAERRESVAEPEGAAAAPEGSATAPPRGAVVYQGWIHSREPTLRALWHRRWAVARQGRLDLYENETMAKIVSTVPLQHPPTTFSPSVQKSKNSSSPKDCRIFLSHPRGPRSNHWPLDCASFTMAENILEARRTGMSLPSTS